MQVQTQPKSAQFKAYHINRNLALSVADAAVDLKRSGVARSSESLIVQAALVRFLAVVRPGCPYLKRFLDWDHEIRERIVGIANLDSIPPV